MTACQKQRNTTLQCRTAKHEQSGVTITYYKRTANMKISNRSHTAPAGCTQDSATLDCAGRCSRGSQDTAESSSLPLSTRVRTRSATADTRRARCNRSDTHPVVAPTSPRTYPAETSAGIRCECTTPAIIDSHNVVHSNSHSLRHR